MISIDGLRPADVLEAEARGLQIPTLRSPRSALTPVLERAAGLRGELRYKW